MQDSLTLVPLLAEVGDKELPLFLYLLVGVAIAASCWWSLRRGYRILSLAPLALLGIINFVELDRLGTEFGRAVISELGMSSMALRFVLLNCPLLLSYWLWRIRHSR